MEVLSDALDSTALGRVECRVSQIGLILLFLLTGCGTTGGSPSCSEPQFSHLQNRGDNTQRTELWERKRGDGLKVPGTLALHPVLIPVVTLGLFEAGFGTLAPCLLSLQRSRSSFPLVGEGKRRHQFSWPVQVAG